MQIESNLDMLDHHPTRRQVLDAKIQKSSALTVSTAQLSNQMSLIDTLNDVTLQ